MLNLYAGKIPWVKATLLSRSLVADNLLCLRFKLPALPGFSHGIPHVPGQHYDIRLTAPGDYVAERSYSIANAPYEEGIVEFGIQLLSDGEVSPYLWSIEPGAEIEMRGPIGGHFVWDVSLSKNLILVGGGSGVVPLMSMLRHYAHEPKSRCEKVYCFVSARTLALIPYKDELLGFTKNFPDVTIAITLTDETPSDWAGYTGRIDETLISKVLDQKGNVASPIADTLIYACGRNGFVDAAASILKKIGYPSETIKTERFG